MLRQSLIAASAVLLAACSQLPAGGPSAGAIFSEASSEASRRFEVLPLDAAVLQFLDGRVDDTFAGAFGSRGGGATDVIGVGDSVSVTIWEAANGGLFSSSAGAIVGGSKSATIPDQPVSQEGTINIPYAGRIQAAGRTPDQVRASIEAALAGKAIEPQVLVTVSSSVFNTVTVTGEVTRGGRIPLTGQGDRLLDVIAAAGGLGAAIHEVFVQLSDDGRVIRVPLQRIVDDPSENVYVRPGDTVTLIRDPQTFTAFGATGRNAEVDFEAVGISLAEALAKSGGLIDTRASPEGVFIFRYEPRELVARMRPESPLLQAGLEEIPVVYQLDLRDPAGLFLAQSFRVYDKDVLYVANASSVELSKFLLILNSVTTSASRATDVYTDIEALTQ
jgi:polysaccharide export outer membrane protein